MDRLLEKIWRFVARDSSLTLRSRLFRLICLAAGILCLAVILPVNLLQKLPPLVSLADVALGLFSFYCFWQSRRGRNLVLVYFVVVMVSMDPVWFLNGGADSSITYYFFPVVLYAVVMFHGRVRWLLAAAVVCNVCALLLLEYRWPGLTTPFHSRTDRLFDLLSGTLASCIAMSIFLWVILASYDWEQHQLARYTKELATSEKHYRELVENAQSIILRVDAQGRVSFFNRFAENLLGYQRQELIGQPAASALPAGQGLAQMLGEVLKNHEAAPPRETEVACRNGRRLSVHWTTQPILDERQQLQEILCVGTDITARKQAEQKVERVNQQLVEISHQAGMAEVATSVLHNVGNVLNSLNVSVNVMADRLRKSPVADLERLAALLTEHEQELAVFLTEDPRGRSVTHYLRMVSRHWAEQQQDFLNELQSAQRNVEHIKQIVATQQNYGRVFGVVQTLSVAELVEDALRMSSESLARRGIQVVREFQPLPPVLVDKHKLLQIVVNLLRNAQYACDEAGPPARQITLRIGLSAPERVTLAVADNGVGIAPENMTRIYGHGFTTRKGGHGYGLHSGALAAKEMGGSLKAHSDGLGKGACFTLEFPLQPPNPQPPSDPTLL